MHITHPNYTLKCDCEDWKNENNKSLSFTKRNSCRKYQIRATQTSPELFCHRKFPAHSQGCILNSVLDRMRSAFSLQTLSQTSHVYFGDKQKLFVLCKHDASLVPEQHRHHWISHGKYQWCRPSAEGVGSMQALQSPWARDIAGPGTGWQQGIGVELVTFRAWHGRERANISE